ncbi:MAG TPA: winged helix DNA-binding domain-containing protein [Candidatus Dormibacteraeota bacterium]|nr:winged helix DNA-binding domain-containing protein [Candidatus Dormibacteraeota bacterium]
MDIVRERLRNQRLIGTRPARTAADVVRWLGAVQAQDYGSATWAVAQRAGDLTSADVERALADGSILRTHVLRPTWHLVVPEDIRWMLRLTAPRVKALMAYGNRESMLDEATFARCNRAIEAALRGGRHLTRVELGHAVRDAGIEFPNLIALGRLVMRAELDGIVCSGAPRGKQRTYALLDERVPATDNTDRDAGLAELAGRYFASHGPATVKDFAWWSGLSVADATAGARTAQPGLHQASLNGNTYWSAPGGERRPRKYDSRAHLLASFDEYTVGYADRSPIRESAHVGPFESRAEAILNNVVLVDGRAMGTWKRAVQKGAVRLAVTAFRPLAGDESAAIAAAAERYGRFLELPAEVDIQVMPATR